MSLSQDFTEGGIPIPIFPEAIRKGREHFSREHSGAEPVLIAQIARLKAINQALCEENAAANAILEADSVTAHLRAAASLSWRRLRAVNRTLFLIVAFTVFWAFFAWRITGGGK